MGINDWVRVVHGLALESGWWVDHEVERNLSPDVRAAKHMLMVTEIAEATEAVRSGEKAPYYWDTSTGRVRSEDVGGGFGLFNGTVMQKPEGEAVELADAVIRIMDYFGFMGWDLEKIIEMKHEYNKIRSFRHGGKTL